MARPTRSDLDDVDPADLPVGETDHGAGAGAGGRSRRRRQTAEPDRGGPAAREAAGGLSVLQAVAAVSLGAVLAAGLVAAVVAAVGGDEGEDEPPTPKPATKKKTPAGGSPRPKKRKPAAAGDRVDVNAAGVAELIALPGIGPAMAAEIVAMRPFASADDLRRVPGIGPSLVKKLGPKLRF